jgi:hypothetical protein
MAGTTPTFSVVFSGGPKLVGRVLVSEALAVELLPEDEQPAASAATAASAVAHAAVRLQLRMPVKWKPLTELNRRSPVPRKDKPASISDVAHSCKTGLFATLAPGVAARRGARSRRSAPGPG